jgi:hypothetical protein
MANLDTQAGSIQQVTAQFGSLVTIDRMAGTITVMPGGSQNILVSGPILDAYSPALLSNKVLIVVNDIVHGRDPTVDLVPGITLVSA